MVKRMKYNLNAMNFFKCLKICLDGLDEYGEAESEQEDSVHQGAHNL